MNDQQLLDGVAMTTSISCEANELAEDYQLSDSSGQQEHSHRNQREVSFESSNQPQTSRRLAETVKVYQLKERSKSQMKFHSGKTSKTANKQWKVLMGLDDNLFEVYFLGLLENTHDMIAKIGQVIVTQEYSRLKSYEKELEEAIASIQFGLNQYDRQKKAFQHQIQLLKAQNDHLNCSIVQLYNVIQSLQKQINNYFEGSLDPYLDINAKRQNIFQVPFARTFSHSLQQIKTIKQTHLYSESISSNDLDNFMNGLLKAIEDMVEGNQNDSLSQLTDKLPFLSDYHFNNVFKHIVDNLNAAAFKLQDRQSKVYQNFPIDEECNKNYLSSFLNNLSNNRQTLLKNLQAHSQPNLYLWHIVSSSVITFLGILCEQSKRQNLEMSFGNSTKLWVKTFLEEIRIMITESKICLKLEEQNYLECLQQFVTQVSQLTAIRMWNNS